MARHQKASVRLAALLSVLVLTTLVPDGRAHGAIRPAQAGETARLVRVHVFSAPDDVQELDAPFGPQQVSAERARGRLTAASCHDPGNGTGAYALSGVRVDGPTTAHFYTGRVPRSLADPVSALRAAFNTWKGAEPAAPSITVVADGTTRRPTANHRYDLMFKRLGTRTLAVTYTWRWSSGEHESDTAFNTQARWLQATGEGDGCYENSNRFDLQNTAAHEFGHVYGLAHVSSPFNTMAPTATTGETYKRSLASGDAAGIRALY